jgi:hypothetical protein
MKIWSSELAALFSMSYWKDASIGIRDLSPCLSTPRI